MNVAVDRLLETYSNGSLKKDLAPFRRASNGSSPGELARADMVQYKNYLARERRKKEIEDLEKNTILQRRREQTKRLTPRQLKLLRQIPLISPESIESIKSSSSSISSGYRTKTDARMSSGDEKTTWASFVEEVIDVSKIRKSPSQSESDTDILSKSVRFGQKSNYSLMSLDDDDEELWKTFSTQHETKMYRALMKEVCKIKRIDKKYLDIRKRSNLKKNDYNHVDQMNIDRLKEGLKDTIPLPGDDFFETFFQLQEAPCWMIEDIKELVTVPDELAVSENINLSQTAATIRMAVWDKQYFKHRKPGEKNIAGLFCQLTKGETPVDKFLYPSKELKEMPQLGCLWEPLMGSEVLEEFCAWLYVQRPELLPHYLKDNGYIHDLIDRRGIRRKSMKQRGTVLERKSVCNALIDISAEFKGKIGRYL